MKHDDHTFKHLHHTVQVHEADNGFFAINTWNEEAHRKHKFIQSILPNTDGPAHALAVLRASCPPDAQHPPRVQSALDLLLAQVEADTARAAAEAAFAGQKQLEEEAVKLYNAFAVEFGRSPIAEFTQMHSSVKPCWAAVAKAARELTGDQQ